MVAPRFFLDVGSPYAYLAGERIERVLPVAPSWEPVLLGGIFKETGRSSWARTEARDEGMRDIERRAEAIGLPPMRWPEPWPGDGLAAMRVAVAAAEGHGGPGAAMRAVSGATVSAGVAPGRAFLLAAMRVAFRDGRNMAVEESILDAAAEAGLDGPALLEAARTPEVKAALRARTEAALALRAIGVPTVVVGAEVFWGDDRLDDAAAATRAANAIG